MLARSFTEHPIRSRLLSEGFASQPTSSKEIRAQ
jgi:hypothetical protein